MKTYKQYSLFLDNPVSENLINKWGETYIGENEYECISMLSAKRVIIFYLEDLDEGHLLLNFHVDKECLDFFRKILDFDYVRNYTEVSRLKALFEMPTLRNYIKDDQYYKGYNIIIREDWFGNYITVSMTNTFMSEANKIMNAVLVGVEFIDNIIKDSITRKYHPEYLEKIKFSFDFSAENIVKQMVKLGARLAVKSVARALGGDIDFGGGDINISNVDAPDIDVDIDIDTTDNSNYDYNNHGYNISFGSHKNVSDLGDLYKTISVESAGGGGSYVLDVYKDGYGHYWVARHKGTYAECINGVAQISLGVNFCTDKIKKKI